MIRLNNFARIRRILSDVGISTAQSGLATIERTYQALTSTRPQPGLPDLLKITPEQAAAELDTYTHNLITAEKYPQAKAEALRQIDAAAIEAIRKHESKIVSILADRLASVPGELNAIYSEIGFPDELPAASRRLPKVASILDRYKNIRTYLATIFFARNLFTANGRPPVIAWLVDDKLDIDLLTKAQEIANQTGNIIENLIRAGFDVTCRTDSEAKALLQKIKDRDLANAS